MSEKPESSGPDGQEEFFEGNTVPTGRNGEGKSQEEEMEGEWFVPVSCAAEELECERASIYALVERGFLSFVQMPGKEIVISVKSIQSFKDSEWLEMVKQKLRI